MNKLVIILACLVVAAAAHPQGYGNNSRGSRRHQRQRQKQCKTVYDVEYVDKLEKECDTKYM